ncbi:hypothetical protein A3Q56_01277 [Intoshia linei]|uniref:Uncharacterized protein n=1 Tax=Intoshia linei TaxID=1819745 RepID=A0A177B9H2_9BILA|nr:hypothetical protein A3Q56_01277 [Intoshia linei]
MNNPLDVRNEEIYFQKVPLNFITLHFKQKYIERLYVKYFAKNLFRINEMKILNNEFCDNKINEPIHQDLLKKESSNMTMKTNAIYKLYKIFLPKFNENTFKDDIPKMKRKLSINWAPLSNIIEHAIIFFVILLIMFCYILNFEYTKLHNVTIILFIFQILCIIICFISSIYEFYYGKMNLYKTKVFNIFFGLWGYNTVSLIIIMFPVLTLMYGYNCSNMIVNNSETLYILLIVVTVVLFIHFNIVTFWTKILAMIVVIFLIIYFMSFDVCKSVIEENKNNNSTIPILQIKNVTMLDYQNITIQNFSIKAIIPILIYSDMYEILKKPIEKYRIMTKDQFFHYPILYFGKINKHNKYIKIQLIVQFTSLLIIVIYINIQCEKLFRQSFYRSLLTLEHQHDIQKRRKYSRILLNKIIPEYVIKEFATKKSYSKDIGTI